MAEGCILDPNYGYLLSAELLLLLLPQPMNEPEVTTQLERQQRDCGWGVATARFKIKACWYFVFYFENTRDGERVCMCGRERHLASNKIVL